MSLLPAKAAALAQHACRPSPRGTVPDPANSSIGGGGGVCLACLAARGVAAQIRASRPAVAARSGRERG